jgi:hypothetical protein
MDSETLTIRTMADDIEKRIEEIIPTITRIDKKTNGSESLSILLVISTLFSIKEKATVIKKLYDSSLENSQLPRP